jgi:hypothetical protein
MRFRFLFAVIALVGASVAALPGCDPGDKSTPKSDGKDKVAQKEETKEGKHGAWWCREHGIPEGECLMCKFSEEELKKKGDLCEKHERAKSQCFKCDPKLREKYAAMYRAKYGKEPPPIEDDEDEKKDDRKEEKKNGNKDTNK